MEKSRDNFMPLIKVNMLRTSLCNRACSVFHMQRAQAHDISHGKNLNIRKKCVPPASIQQHYSESANASNYSVSLAVERASCRVNVV